MPQTLLVPIHLDALVLAKSHLSVGPAAHFARLPHVYAGADVNPDIPNLGKSVIAPPFQDKTFLLEKGVHLHWALPDGLTRAYHADREAGPSVKDHEDEGFPAVPNRWLVVRRGDKGGGKWKVENKWLVESDYLFDDDDPNGAASVSVPSTWSDKGLQARQSKRPYRYMGRQTVWEDGRPSNPGRGTNLSRPLTAMGYGDPTFAAVYQNCQFVFGLHDPDVLAEGATRRYDVFGWYSDSARDPLRALLKDEGNPTAGAKAVAARFGWSVAAPMEIPAGSEIVCFVSMTIPANRIPKDRNNHVELAIGNTGSEAMSAYIGGTIHDGGMRETVEDQLESLLLGAELSGKRLDLAARLADARHEKGFVATFGGWVWTVKPEEPAGAASTDAARAPEEPLDPVLGELLTRLNDRERSYDQGLRDLEAARGQLFADWCKYMRVVYPPDAPWQEHETFDADALRQFIEERGIQPLEEKLDEVGELWLQYDRDQAGNPSILTGALDARLRKPATNLSERTPTTAFKLAEMIQQALKRIAKVNEERTTRQARPLILQRIPGPRFYRPAEPALLIRGEALRTTERHGQDGRESEDGMLQCFLSSAILPSKARSHDDAGFLAEIDRLRPAGGAERIGFCAWKEPWHPILLEWEVDLLPIPRCGQRGCDHYAKDHIEIHYTLEPKAVELAAKPGAPHDEANKKTFRGSSILTSHAHRLHDKTLRACIVQHCGCSPAELSNERGRVEADYRRKPGVMTHDPICTALCALEAMEGRELLTQSLTGFNDALLGLHQSYQLPIEDPLGFDCERKFSEQVRGLVLSHNRSAPDDAGGFNPIRAGQLKVKRLRLVDTFGKTVNLKFDEPHVSRSLRVKDGNVIELPPRFVQPARLNLRWLSTVDGKTETSVAPTSTPICGWVVLDNFDASLLIYDASGRALGVISNGGGLWQAGWQMAPGEGSVERVWNIQDADLQRVATWLVGKAGNPGEWDPLLKGIEKALENIDPEGFAHHEDLAVLMGRPLAVVRAHLGVALCGPPAIHQGPDALLVDMKTESRRTDQFEGVEIPIRLGADDRANDGLVAYWRETKAGLGEAVLRQQYQTGLPIRLAPSSEGQTLTMLVDPLAEVHATTGVLPTKSITIPASMYADALKRIEVTFRSLGPILTRVGRLDLPLPVEPGFSWSWIERDDRGWTSVAGDVGAAEDDGAFSGEIVAREGWLKLTKVDPSQAP